MTNMFEGVGTIVLVVFLIFSVCAVFCYLRALRRRTLQRSTSQRRGHAMVYSVTMQGGGGGSFYNSVTEFLRSSENEQLEQTSSTRNRLGNVQFENDKGQPLGLPSYDDVISGKFGGNIENPPPYSESNSDGGRNSSLPS